jgi:hypothetical protein
VDSARTIITQSSAAAFAIARGHRLFEVRTNKRAEGEVTPGFSLGRVECRQCTVEGGLERL